MQREQPSEIIYICACSCMYLMNWAKNILSNIFYCAEKYRKNVLLIPNEHKFSVIGPVSITCKTLQICTPTTARHAQYWWLQSWMGADVHSCPLHAWQPEFSQADVHNLS